MKKSIFALTLVSAVALYAAETYPKNKAAAKTAPAKAVVYWHNSDFSEWSKIKRNANMKNDIKDDMMPSYWILNKTTGKISKETKKDNPQDKYVKITDCRIYQPHKGTEKKYAVSLDVKGSGSLNFYVNRYKREWKGKTLVTKGGLGAENIAKIKPSPDQWKTFKMEYTKKNETEMIGFVLDAKGEISVDNMTVTPMEGSAK